MTQQNQEAKQTDREPEEKLEIKALFQTKRIPANVLCGFPADVPDGVSCKHGLKLQDHLHIKKEEEELWESLEEKQETDITAVTVKSEDEEEEAQCSLLHWRQSEENIKGEPATCSSAKLMKVEPNGDISEGPEAANTCTQQDTDGEETDCSDTEDSEDWREPLSQSEAQSEHMDMSCENFQTSENNTRGTSHNTQKPFGCDVCEKKLLGVISRLSHPLTQMAESMETRMASLEEVVVESRASNCDCSDLKRQRQVHNTKIAGTMRLRHNSEGKDGRYDIIQGG
ncbi:uncharacterized protein LOC114463992 isoform X20 [Gouania willdenowi]|uniref:uncharacterized protein LOC114463992 isoform X20 n=1 Tax=Gouania willdenowi TaxID=441366 RepID=UPI0010541AA6|nr:uncharacterized protein LOC114463992 isoform X20 [Gouania willdenowi]